MKYLIETVNNEIIFDFCFHTIEAIKIKNWLDNKNNIKYIKISIEKIENHKYKKYIPIGSIEFVLKFYKYFFNIELKPVNLLNFKSIIDRRLKLGSKFDIKNGDFIKEIDRFKGITDIYDKYIDLPEDNRTYMISEPLNILSEYRIFVFRGKIVGINNYSGDFRLFPDIKKINKYILNFEKYNKYNSYTMDFAILENKKIKLIEIHQFFSCGLYGFNNYNILLNMFNQTHHDIIKEGKNNENII